MNILTQKNLSHQIVHQLIEKISCNLLKKHSKHELSVIIMRGGALLESSFTKNSHNIGKFYPKLRKFDYEMADLKDVNTLHICDVIVDSGQTMLDSIAFFSEHFPGKKLTIYTIFATESALSILNQTNVSAIEVADIFGKENSICKKPMDIPYDFGDVACLCNLVN